MVRRRLIDQSTFDKTITESATTAEYELREASDVVAKTLGKDALSFYCFDNNKVIYETVDGSYIQANYAVNKDSVVFDNIEEVIVDENSRNAKMRQVLGEMFDALIDEKEAKTSDLFHQYLEMKKYRKKMMDKQKSHKKKTNKMGAKCMGKKCMAPEEKMKMKNIKMGVKMMKGKAKKMCEALINLASNVFDYVDYVKYGPVMAETVLKHDDKGNIVALKTPTNENRNYSNLLSFNWKTLNNEVKSLREMAFGLGNNNKFKESVVNLKRQANVVDDNALSESLEQVGRQWPAVLYLTQSELAKQISSVLEEANVTNYDDSTCNFLAEGILYTAFNMWSDRSNRIMQLAGVSKPSNDEESYERFQEACDKLYSNVDQKFVVEQRVFKDLYEAMYEIYRQADRRGDEALKQDCVSYLNELAEVVKGEAVADIDLADEVSKWITNFVETNLEMSPWVVNNTPHVTVSGDHPDMAKKAAHPYTPSRDFSGDWGDPAPALDDQGGSYKGNGPDQMRNNSWGNMGGNDVYPNVHNPYVPKPGEFTMPNDKGVDKDWKSAHGSYQDSDTWPNVQNPYVPKAIHNWKMNHNPEDLVVNK